MRWDDLVGAVIAVRTQIAEKTNVWMLNVNWNVRKMVIEIIYGIGTKM